MIFTTDCTARLAYCWPHTLDACSKRKLPCVLVTCKCDLPVASRQLDLQAIEESCHDKAGIDCFQASLKAPETHKRCISVMLKNLAPEKLGQCNLYLIQSLCIGHFSRWRVWVLQVTLVAVHCKSQ